MVKNIFVMALLLTCIARSSPTGAQDKAVYPSLVITGVYHGETGPLRDIPALTGAEWQIMQEKAEQKMLNPKIRYRSFPFAATALPLGPDPVWQRVMGAGKENRGPIVNSTGQDSPYYPPDANGTAGPNHYMQTINTIYSIYNKSGTLVAGPSALNSLFEGVPGSECNNGDPIILFDEQAERWLVAEFSLCGLTDYMLIAVSTTNDPTGTWHKYSFDVDDMPDYEKFGIWQDGYYMGTNNSLGNDIYVFERSKMLIGEEALAVGFDNPWRPMTNDGFMCVPPLDNDGTFAPGGEPGMFITINDDAVGGGSDQLWIYELDVDWVSPENSTFNRSQQINVSAFDSNFGTNWDNIKQPGTSRELDALPQVIMNPPQYRNFGTYETILCCHTVDVDNTDHAGIRWYELRRINSDNWIIRQQGTYAPDEHSRWMGSIMLNGQNEIALAYSISSATLYPGIRYCGQSSSAYTEASGQLDIAEEIIHTGTFSQSSSNRWGDYSALQVDPTDDDTFWFTSQYIGSAGARKTRIASFNFNPVQWTGTTSGNWNTPSNWSTGSVPTISSVVIIPSAAPNWPAYTGNLALGAHCAELRLEGDAQMTVSGDFTIGSGRILTFTGNGQLSIDGNWMNSGTFIPGTGTVIFTGASPASLSTSGTSSNITNYVRSEFPKNMTALTGATAGPTGDNGNMVVPIGFSFNYIGTDYTQLRLSTNGWVSLNQSGTTTGTNEYLFNGTHPNTTIAPWFDNLNDNVTSMVSYKTEGTPPFRVFTAEWYRVFTYNSVATARISFQLNLFETTNVIEFHYGNLEEGTHHASEGASIGLEDATGGIGHFIEATTGSTTSGITNLVSTNDWPNVNYRFAPPAPDALFQHIIINKGGSYVDFNSNTIVTGTFTVMPGDSFNVKNGTITSVTGIE